MKYTNTRPVPVRLFTSKGRMMLDGMTTIELDEVIAVPAFVTIEGAPEPVVEPVEEPVVTTEKPKRRRRLSKKKTEE